MLASVLSGSMEAPVGTRWTVGERDGRRNIEISTEATAAARLLLDPGVSEGPIDVNVLLPLLAGLKIAAGETAENVAVDLPRLALKHPLGFAQDEVSAITRGDPTAIAQLASALDVSGRALVASWELIGTDGDLSVVLSHIREARAAAIACGKGERAQFASLARGINALLDHYHSLPERELLPETVRCAPAQESVGGNGPRE